MISSQILDFVVHSLKETRPFRASRGRFFLEQPTAPGASSKALTHKAAVKPAVPMVMASISVRFWGKGTSH